MVPETPFKSLAIPKSSEEFLYWTRTLFAEDEAATPRRVA
jgi:hypothetical protein